MLYLGLCLSSAASHGTEGEVDLWFDRIHEYKY
jgi:hypothetical protein